MSLNNTFLQKIRARRERMGRKGLRRKPPKWLFPESLKRQYMNYMLTRLKDFENDIERLLVSRLPEFKTQASIEFDGARADNFADDIKNITALLTVAGEEVFGDAEDVAYATAVGISNFNAEQYRKIINTTLGVDPLINDAHLSARFTAFASHNASLINSIPRELLKDVEGVVTRGLTGGETVDAMTAKIQQRFKVSRNRARLIARDQTGKLNGQLTRVRQQRVDIDEYIWRTSDDERVRSSHNVLDDKVCRWDDDTVYRDQGSEKWLSRSSIGGYIGVPGSDYQCRCFGEPILDDFIDNS